MQFAVIYRSYTKPGRESEFCRLWHQVASYFIAHAGAVGSCLHRTDDGLWLAYSRWPSRAKRDAAWPQEKQSPSEVLPLEIRHAIGALKDCLDESRKLPELCMEVVDDLF